LIILCSRRNFSSFCKFYVTKSCSANTLRASDHFGCTFYD